MEIEDFIQTIVAEPDVDEHRLVFADYLEEHGDPRAELIRLQFAMRDVNKMDSTWAGLRKKELKLLREHGGFGEAPKFGRILSWHGGFVDEIETTLAQFANNQEKLLAHTTVRGVQLRATSKRFKNLFDSPHLGRLQKLTFKNNHIPSEEMCEFLSLKGLASLKSLKINEHEFSPGVVDKICEMPHFSSLESLELSGDFVEANSAIAIVESQYIDGLTSLTLNGSVSDEAANAIANSDKFKNLCSLELSGELTDQAAISLHDSVFRGSLQKLVLHSGDWEAYYRSESADREFGSGFVNPLPNLKSLEIGWRVGDEALIAIAKNYRNLETLELGHNQITDRGAEALANSELLASIKRLVFTENQITIRGAEAIRESKHWNRKTKLYLRSNNISRAQRSALKEKYGKTFGNLGTDRSW